MGRLLTWLFKVKQRPLEDAETILEELSKVRQRTHRLEIAFDELLGRQDSLAKQLQRLRGQVTGGIRRGSEGGSGLDSIPVGDKEALRQYAGLALVKKSTREE